MTTSTDISRIAAAVSIDRLMPRKCSGCKETDFSVCAPCYRKLYPRHKVTRAQEIARKLYRRLEVFAFVWSFVDETGYGVTMDWIKLNLVTTKPVTVSTIYNDIDDLVKAGALVKTRETRRDFSYWPAGNTLIKSDTRHPK